MPINFRHELEVLPILLLKMIISMAATVDRGPRAEEKVVMVNDVARAFFEAPARRTVPVALPQEANLGERDRGQAVLLLQLSLYGTRDAAANFQEEVKVFSQKAGFEQCTYNPSMYLHRGTAHGDDFVSTSGWVAAL
jgi:hypothetical protein